MAYPASICYKVLFITVEFCSEQGGFGTRLSADSDDIMSLLTYQLGEYWPTWFWSVDYKESMVDFIPF